MLNTINTTAKENQFIEAYLEAVYFTDTGDLEQPDSDASLDVAFIRESIIDCLAFYKRIHYTISGDAITQAGHDFWLTRNGHGTGFWDNEDIYGEYLAGLFTTWAEGAGPADSSFEDQ
jgi:hypothetical protein